MSGRPDARSAASANAAGRGSSPGSKSIPARPRNAPSSRRALLVGWWMHSVQERNPAPGKPSGGGDVRGEHALLDELVGDAPGRGLDVRDLAVRPEDDAGLPDLEVEGAPPPARLAQRRVDLPERLEMRGTSPPSRRRICASPSKHRRLHLLRT